MALFEDCEPAKACSGARAISSQGGGALPEGAETLLREFLGPHRRLGSVTELSLKRMVRDHCEKFIALDDHGNPAAFVIVSPESHPDVVSDAAQRAVDERGALGERLGANVLTPFRVAVSDGRSYSIFAYCRPLSGRRLFGGLERRLLAPKVLRWLEEAVVFSRKSVDANSLDRRVVQPLRAIEDDSALDTVIRRAAATALDDVRSERWHPSTVATHNDLWWGNLVHGLSTTGASPEFYVIDWGGGDPAGTPIGDLVRLSMSLGLSPRRCGLWIDRHRRTLDCRPVDVLGYLLIGFGALSLNRREWPAERFLQATHACFRYASEAIDTRARRSSLRSF